MVLLKFITFNKILNLNKLMIPFHLIFYITHFIILRWSILTSSNYCSSLDDVALCTSRITCDDPLKFRVFFFFFPLDFSTIFFKVFVSFKIVLKIGHFDKQKSIINKFKLPQIFYPFFCILHNNKAKQIKNYCVFCVWVSDIIHLVIF